MGSKERQGDPETVGAAALAGKLRVVVGRLGRRLREQTQQGDLGWSHLSALARLERDGPATVTTLARAEGVRSQSMGATVSVLEAAGFVVGAPDPTDGRQTILSLTEASRAMIMARRAAREDWLLRAIRSELATGEQKKLAACVALLERLADSHTQIGGS